MKVVDAIETREHVEKLTETQRDDLFTRLVMGKDVTEEIKTSRGTFVIKYPKPKDMLAIGKIMAARRGWQPASAFDNNTETLNAMASTLDVIVVSGPEWFEKARQKNAGFSFFDLPGDALIAELYTRGYSFRQEVEQRLEAGAEPGSGGLPAQESADEAVDGGAFGGLSSE